MRCIDGIAIRTVGHPGQQGEPRPLRSIVSRICRGGHGAFADLPEEPAQAFAEQAAVYPFESLGPVADHPDSDGNAGSEIGADGLAGRR